MASIHVRHSRRCGLGSVLRSLAASEQARKEGLCPTKGPNRCTPTYYVAIRDGKSTKLERVGKAKEAAERRLKELDYQESAGILETIDERSFDQFAKAWQEALDLKPSTSQDYAFTIGYLREFFGAKKLNKISRADVRAFEAWVAKKGATDNHPERRLSAVTVDKHRRILSALLADALEGNHVSRNVALASRRKRGMRQAEKPRAWFTNDELARLIVEIPEPYRVLFELAWRSGLRQGEIVALRWGAITYLASDESDVQPLARIEVRANFTHGVEGTPKSGKGRAVVVDGVAHELAAHWRACGEPADDVLVFQRLAPGGGYLDGTYLLRHVLYPAMQRAGIARVGPSGEDEQGRRDFQALRHTAATRWIQAGRSLGWISKQLGHHSPAFTARVYARHFERSAIEAEAWEFARWERDRPLASG